jgi:predicted CopG family antitoxin
MLLRSQRLNDPQVAAVRETYRYYDERIRSLYEEAEPLLTANPDISTELNLGMTELESLSAQIIRDLDDNIASSEVIEALIGNYRLRIELLEDMLNLMKEEGVEAEKNKGNEL